MSARFTVIVYGDIAFRYGTYDEIYTRITDHHKSRQRSAGFRIDFSVTHYDPHEAIPYNSGYAIVDNHTADVAA